MRKIIGWSAIALVALIAVLLVILLLVDVTVYRGQLQSGVSTVLGRSVRFEGDISLTPSLWPTIVVEDVHIANPEWASRPNFSSAERLEFQVALLPLIRGDLKILKLALEGSDILLETRPDGRNNWTFKEKRDKPTALPDIESLTWRRSVVAFRSGPDRVHRLTISEAEAVLTEGERIQIDASGTYQDVRFTLSLLGGTPSTLVASDRPWPIKLAAQAAGATIEVEGTVTRPLEGKGFDLQIAVRGEQTEDLSSLLDVALPALGPYALSGRVTEADNRYSITNFTGHLASAEAVWRLALTKGTASAPVDAPIELRLEGAYADVPFTVSLVGGSLAELIAPTKPWPVKLEADVASASVHIEGTVAEPLAWDDFDIKVAASGKEIGDLSPLIDAELPALGAYALSARVTAIDKGYTVTDLAGYLGKGKAKNHLAIKKGEASVPDGKPLSLKVQGSYGDVPFRVSLDGGTLAELTAPTKPWPIKMKASAAGAALDINGTVAWPVEGKGLGLRVKVRGKQLSALEPLLGIAVPALGVYELSGRIVDKDDGYTVTDFKAAIAGTDVAGMLALDSKAPRPHVRAKLASKRFDLEKLMPAGAPSSTEDREPVSLDAPLPTAIFQVIDADLNLTVKRLVGAPTAIRDLSVTAKLKDGQLTVAPIAMSLPGGQIKGRVQLDASADNPRLGIDLTADQFDIDKLKVLANVKELRAGANDLQIHLASRGKTVRELLEGSKFQLTTGAVDVRYRTEIAGHVVPIRLSKVAITTDPGQPINIALEGTLRRLPFSLRYSGDTLANLAAARETWPVALSGHVAGLTFETKGEVIRPFGEEDFDLTFTFTGKDLDALDPLLDIDLPTRGPYRLTGRIMESDNIYRLVELEFSLEDNHATGSLRLTMDGPRPHIVAKLVASELHLEDVIEDLNEGEDEADDKRLFSDFVIPVDALRAVDADVELTVTDVIGNVTDLGEISVKIKLENGHLIVSPLEAVLAGGQISSNLDLDARPTPPVASLQVAVKDLDYGRLLGALDIKDIAGKGDININLTSRGATLHGLLGQVNGKAEFVSEAGKIGRRDIDLWAAGLVTTMLSPKWQREQFTELNCLVARFDVTDGVAQTSPILLDTTRITVAATGTLDLGTEQLDMVLIPAPKKASFISLATPVKLTGTLVEPEVSITKKSKFKSFSKILLPFVNPAYLVYSGDLGSGGQNACEAAIAAKEAPADEAKKKRGFFRRFLQKSKPSEKAPDAESTKTN